MSKHRIAIGNNLASPVEVANAPLKSSLRWRSPYEDDAHGWPAIFMVQEAYRQINAHAQSDLSCEVGGMLVGQALQTPEGEPYITITNHLPARHVDHGPMHLTFSSESQIDMLNRLEDEHPGQRAVGWYHTHPGMAVFMSAMDTWLHRYFYPQPWHAALVIEPQAGHGGFFRYAEGQMDHTLASRYVGFYELIEADTESIVDWHNLSAGESDLAFDVAEAEQS